MEKKINNSKVNTNKTVASTASNAWAGCRTYAHSEEDELLDLDKVTDSKGTATTTQFTTTGITIPELKAKFLKLSKQGAQLVRRLSRMEAKFDILQSLFNTAATALSDEDLVEEYASEEDFEDLDDVECNDDYDGDGDYHNDYCDEDERDNEDDEDEESEGPEESEEDDAKCNLDLAEGVRLLRELRQAVLDFYRAVILVNADLYEDGDEYEYDDED